MISSSPLTYPCLTVPEKGEDVVGVGKQAVASRMDISMKMGACGCQQEFRPSGLCTQPAQLQKGNTCHAALSSVCDTDKCLGSRKNTVVLLDNC